MLRCCPPRPMRWNAATGAIARCKKVSTGCAHKSRSVRALLWTCGEKPKAKGVTKRSKPYITRVQGERDPVSLLYSQFLQRSRTCTREREDARGKRQAFDLDQPKAWRTREHFRRL